MTYTQWIKQIILLSLILSIHSAQQQQHQQLCHLIVNGTAEKIIIGLSLLAKWEKKWNILNM
jgi:hypothetical protein